MISNALTPTVPLQLDRERHMRLDFNALATIEEVLGESALDGSVFKPENLSLARYLRAILYATLKHEDPNLTLEEVGAMLSLSNVETFSEVRERLDWHDLFAIACLDFGLTPEEFARLSFRSFNALVERQAAIEERRDVRMASIIAAIYNSQPGRKRKQLLTVEDVLGRKQEARD